MDGYSFQLEADAAEAEGYVPKDSEAANKDAKADGQKDTLPTFSSMFGLAASWGKKIQEELQIDQIVDQVKKQSEEVTKAYKQDITEFAQAVKVGATRGIDEISTRFNQIKADLEDELKDGDKDAEGSTRQVVADGDNNSNNNNSSSSTAQGLFKEVSKHFQMDALKERQEKAKRLMSKLGADLEDLLRDAIVIEAPGSASTEEQRNAARKIIYDRRMAQLAAIQESEDTYLADPSAQAIDAPGVTSTSSNKGKGAEESNDVSTPGYAEFAKDFDLQTRKDDMEELLKNNTAVAEMHKKLVSEKVSEGDFWTRYYFRAWLIDQEELRRKKLVEAAVAATEEEDFSWDMDEDSDSETKDKSAKPKAESAGAAESKQDDKANTAASASASASASTVAADTPATSNSQDNDESKSAKEDGEDAESAKAGVVDSTTTEAAAVDATKDSEAKKAEEPAPKKADKSNSNDDDDAWDEWE
ncbi:hypothetical protein GGI12_004638 [Dipsacomyces acuminosporus]|nr:hypothetical protein GGI12_004638 [Dipsacomyces acuminosporus]